MGQPVLCREKEIKSAVSTKERTLNIADLSPEEQAEWARKYGLDLDKINGRITQPVTAEDPGAKKEQPEQPKVLTRESYIKLKEQRLNDTQIRRMFGIKSPNDLTNWKEKNGLKGYQLKPDTTLSAVINEKTDIRFKKDSPATNMNNELPSKETQSGNSIKSFEEKLAKKDEQLKRYEALLTETNKARLDAEARVEALQIELSQHKANKAPLDLRAKVAGLMSSGAAEVETFEEFQTIADVLGKMKMAWIATHDTYRFNIETTP